MDVHLNAAKHERTEERTGSRNGHYERGLTTRLGQLTLKVPRDRDGTFSTALFERYSRSERALVCALVEMVVCGVSTRRVKKITTELCGEDISKSTISGHCEELDEMVQAWRQRPLEAREYPFVLVDALQLKVRQDGRVESMALLIATGIDEQGDRRILGMELGHAENEHHWRDFFRQLKKRGLSGVELVTSDAHQGLVKAVRRVFGGVVWQRCQTHFRRNVTEKAPKRYRDELHKGLDAILKAKSKKEASQKVDALLEELEGRCEKALTCLEDGWEDACAVLDWPSKYRRRLRTTNMVERLNEELRRRDKVIRIYPNAQSAIRLMGAQLVEHDEKWSTSTRYLKMHEFYDWKRQRELETQAVDVAAAAE